MSVTVGSVRSTGAKLPRNSYEWLLTVGVGSKELHMLLTEPSEVLLIYYILCKNTESCEYPATLWSTISFYSLYYFGLLYSCTTQHLKLNNLIKASINLYQWQRPSLPCLLSLTSKSISIVFQNSIILVSLHPHILISFPLLFAPFSLSLSPSLSHVLCVFLLYVCHFCAEIKIEVPFMSICFIFMLLYNFFLVEAHNRINPSVLPIQPTNSRPTEIETRYGRSWFLIWCIRFHLEWRFRDRTRPKPSDA